MDCFLFIANVLVLLGISINTNIYLSLMLFFTKQSCYTDVPRMGRKETRGNKLTTIIKASIMKAQAKTFNSGRKYSAKGQRIAYCTIADDKTLMVDIDRDIEYVLNCVCHCDADVMKAYDNGNNDYASKYKYPQIDVLIALANTI